MRQKNVVKCYFPDKKSNHIDVNMLVDKFWSPVTSKEREFSFTCDECFFVPSADGIDDIQTLPIISEITGRKKTINLRFPTRCKRCEREKKRDYRRRKQMRRVYDVANTIGIFLRTYHRPKLITFALPSERSECYSDRDDQIQLLLAKMPRARKQLMQSGTLGGTYAIECTSRLVPMNDGGHLLQWKHHAHCHMVAISNFVHHTKIKEYCEQLMNLGLGRINLKAPQNYRAVSTYISKYLNKENQRRRTFGIMRGLSTCEKECRCRHDEFVYEPGDCCNFDGTINYRGCDCLV